MDEIVLSNELLGDVCEANAEIFGTVKWRAQVEVADVKGEEFGTAERQDAVDNHLD